MQIEEKNHLLKNPAKLTILSCGANVALTHLAAAVFAAQADLTLSEIDEIKVAVSEAVSNAVIHGYGEAELNNQIEMTMNLYDGFLEYIVTDHGHGIKDIKKARLPSETSDPERMGMGFVFMESFMDELEVKSKTSEGTTVIMRKKFKPKPKH
ncbi:MAG: anti-sigma F factor [Sporomusaceae bacterium]|jgi:stage II sporulation protein AB (anti-sigma F factor)|nr:anti-sigma F factor [Sporomusaceae bacterium]